MSDNYYWDGFASRRISRRGMVKGSAVAGIAVVGGIACSTSSATPTAVVVAPANTPAAAAPAATAQPTVAPTPPGGTPKYGGIVTFGVTGETPSLDPHATTSTLLFAQGPGLIYSRLVKPSSGPERKDNELLINGDAAETITQPDDLTYIFKLRPNVKFHNIAPVNGRALTADDVVYSFNRQKDLKSNAAVLPPFEKIEAVDKQTVKITVAKPDADFLAALASTTNVIVAKEAVDVKGDLKEGPHIGSGPWLFDSFDKGVTAKLKRNPDYFIKGVPYPDGMEFLRIADDATSKAAFRTGKIAETNTHFTKKDVDSVKKDFPELITSLRPVNGSGLEMGFDQTKPPFNDKRVRQAFSLALDRQAMIDTNFDGAGWWTLNIFFADMSYNLPEDEFKTKLYKRDVAQAKQLLTAAGVQPGLEVEFTFLQFSQVWTDACTLAIAQLKDIGVNAKLKAVDGAVWSGTTSTGQGGYQAYMGPLLPATSTTGDLRGRLYSTGNHNQSKTKDAKLDDMIDKQATITRDPAARKAALQELQRYIVDQAYISSMVGFISAGANWPWLKNLRRAGQPGGDGEPVNWVWLDK
jgi:peptide/nickel transport system substrate-binding protein